MHKTTDAVLPGDEVLHGRKKQDKLASFFHFYGDSKVVASKSAQNKTQAYFKELFKEGFTFTRFVILGCRLALFEFSQHRTWNPSCCRQAGFVSLANCCQGHRSFQCSQGCEAVNNVPWKGLSKSELFTNR
jgi:hypothetical protein